MNWDGDVSNCRKKRADGQTEVKKYSKKVKRRTFIYNDSNKRIAEKCWLIRFYCLFLRNSYSFRSVLLLSFIILTHLCCCCCMTLRHIGDVVQFRAYSKRREDNAASFWGWLVSIHTHTHTPHIPFHYIMDNFAPKFGVTVWMCAFF